MTSQYTDFTATDTDSSAYISWNDNGTTKYVGVSDDVSIYGGGDGREKAVTLPSTSITMTGGTVWNLFGGNYGEETKDENFCSTVEGECKHFAFRKSRCEKSATWSGSQKHLCQRYHYYDL